MNEILLYCYFFRYVKRLQLFLICCQRRINFAFKSRFTHVNIYNRESLKNNNTFLH